MELTVTAQIPHFVLDLRCVDLVSSQYCVGNLHKYEPEGCAPLNRRFKSKVFSENR